MVLGLLGPSLRSYMGISGEADGGRVSLNVEMNERSMVSDSLEPVIEAGVPGPSPSSWYLLMDSVWRRAMQLHATGLGLVLV